MKPSYAIIFLLVLAITGCKNNEKDSTESTEARERTQDYPIGKASFMLLKNTRQVNANVGIAPAGLVQVNVPFSVFVSGVQVAEGQAVKKGQVLASISHPDLIDLQQNWIVADLDHTKNKERYMRLKGLSEGASVSLQELQAAESEWKQSAAKEQALRSKLMMLGVNPGDVQLNGIFRKINVVSPVNGVVAVVSANEGQLLDAGSSLFEVLDTDHIRIELNLPPDLSLKLSDQPKLYWTGGEAEVYAVDPGLFSQDRTRKAYARPTSVSHELRVGEFFTADLILDADSVWALPVYSVIIKGDSAHMFRIDEGAIEELTFKPGSRNKEWVAIPETFAAMDSLVLGKAHRLGLGEEE